jgi:mRNA-degrading endonuclease RelE of RelBE toxin-antitoxin system
VTEPPEDQGADDRPARPQPYALVLAPGARRASSETLPPAAAFAAWEFINGPLREQPRRVGAPLLAPFEGLWWARRGEYRVRYRIDEDNREVHVLDVDHRRDAYRR